MPPYCGGERLCEWMGNHNEKIRMLFPPSDALANFNDSPSLPFRGRVINRMSIPTFSTTVEFLGLALK
jgi:hypothetical protein